MMWGCETVRPRPTDRPPRQKRHATPRPSVEMELEIFNAVVANPRLILAL